jgi:hypothetical protein
MDFRVRRSRSGISQGISQGAGAADSAFCTAPELAGAPIPAANRARRLAQVLHLPWGSVMDHGLEIIPIFSKKGTPKGSLRSPAAEQRRAEAVVAHATSHRRAPASGARPQSAAAAHRKRRGWGLPLAAAAGLLLIAMLALARAPGAGSVQGLPPDERAALYERTLADTESSCAMPDARAGALRDHCLRQAEFLVLFPECDRDCRQLTSAILPHATR